MNIIKTTEKAAQIEVTVVTSQGFAARRKVWFPKSRTELCKDSLGSFVIVEPWLIDSKERDIAKTFGGNALFQVRISDDDIVTSLAEREEVLRVNAPLN